MFLSNQKLHPSEYANPQEGTVEPRPSPFPWGRLLTLSIVLHDVVFKKSLHYLKRLSLLQRLVPISMILKDFISQYMSSVATLTIVKICGVFVKRKCEQKGPKKVSTFSTRFHVVSNAFPKYQMLTF